MAQAPSESRDHAHVLEGVWTRRACASAIRSRILRSPT
jgi:hypothetical protein